MRSNKQESKLQKFTRKHKQYVKAANKGINRESVLSSKRNLKLPSARGSIRLKSICDEALKDLEEARQAWEDRANLTAKNLLLDKKYQKDPKALKELPHKYLNTKRLKVLTARYQSAMACYEALAEAYKDRTGKTHKPSISEQVNKPLDLQSNVK